MRIRTGLTAVALTVAGVLATAGGAVADDFDVQFVQNFDVPLPQGACNSAQLLAIPIDAVPNATATCESGR
ncbi:hypothetical protein ACIQI7_32440 [Kitasatospora sp. NPDC092039]|uniref:hypothetical protein n=1 Tax=Kitasatospora sp. NPDC092039 TaxID=3364086 RepID=UPI0037F60603